MDSLAGSSWRRILEPTLGGLLGLAYFVSVFGVNILDPENIGWLMALAGDPGTHFIGWHFFRHEDWHLPLGSLHRYGMEIAASVVYSDSIPLLALLFKPFSPWLPEIFQYSGIWIALCYFLQGFFAWMLMRHASGNFFVCALGAGFFILSPIMLFRGNAHFSLMGHWLILAGLVLYLAPASRGLKWRWAILASVASLVHAYLAVMVLAIWAADLFRRFWLDKSLSGIGAIHAVLALALPLASVMWLAGYFVVGGVSGGGSTLYSMNLLAPFLPTPGVVSPYLPNHLAATPYQYEGFSYFGLGMLLLLAAGLFLVRQDLQRNVFRLLLPLAGVCLILAVYALSYRVTLGNNVLFEIPLPALAKKATEIFRASGRMFWPAYYGIMLGVMALIVSRRKAWIAALMLGFAFIVQFSDLGPLRRAQDAVDHIAPRFDSPLSSPFWHEAGRHYRRVIVVPPVLDVANFIPPTLYAAMHGMAINIAYYGRPPSPEAERLRQERIIRMLSDGKIDNDALYILKNRELLKFLGPFITRDTAVGIVDGELVLAPGWLGLEQSAATRKMFAPYVPQRNFAPLNSDAVISFNSADSQNYAVAGLSHTEASGTWTDGSIAAIGLRLPDQTRQDWQADFEVQPFVSDKHPTMDVSVTANGQPVAVWHFEHGREANARKIVIPRALVDQWDGNLFLVFHVRSPVSPGELGMSGDPRQLGLKLVTARFRPS